MKQRVALMAIASQLINELAKSDWDVAVVRKLTFRIFKLTEPKEDK